GLPGLGERDGCARIAGQRSANENRRSGHGREAGCMKRFWLIVVTGSLVALAGCHSFKKENIQPPTPLAKDFKQTVQVTRVWKDRVGHGAGVSGVRMQPTVVNGVLYAASTDGAIAALDANTGKTLWETKS